MESIPPKQNNDPNNIHSHSLRLCNLITNAFQITNITVPTNYYLHKSASMDNVASSSSSSNHHHHHCYPQSKSCNQPIAERIVRALRHRLLLLHRSDSIFFILGATGNVYTVTLSSTPSCTCPDRTTPCKHILFVYIRVLGLSLEDVCIRRRTLRPCHLGCLLRLPTLPDAVAGTSLRESFHQQYFRMRQGSLTPVVEIKDGTTCPVCLEEMGKEERVVACGTCRNPIHEECLVRWKRSRGRRSVCCVICRARWTDRTEQRDKYLNLAAYVSEDDLADANDGSNACGS